HTRFSRDWSSDVCSSDLIGSRIVEIIAHSDARRSASTATRRRVRAAGFANAVGGTGAGVVGGVGPLALQVPDAGVDERDGCDGRSEERRVGKEGESRGWQ